MALDRKFLQDVEELIDIAHRASSDEATKNAKQGNSAINSETIHAKNPEAFTNQNSTKPRSRLSKIQKAFILAEILPRKY